MSKKRNKNARKKTVKRKAQDAAKAQAPAVAAPGPTPPSEEVEPDVVVDAVTAKEGGGAIDMFRTRLTPGKGRDGDTLLTKRRSVGELSLWLAAAGAVVWVVWKIVRTLNPPI